MAHRLWGLYNHSPASNGQTGGPGLGGTGVPARGGVLGGQTPPALCLGLAATGRPGLQELQVVSHRGWGGAPGPQPDPVGSAPRTRLRAAQLLCSS